MLTWTKVTNGYEATGANGDRYAVLRTPGRRFLLRRNDADTDHKPGKLDAAKAAAEALEASLPPPVRSVHTPLPGAALIEMDFAAASELKAPPLCLSMEAPPDPKPADTWDLPAGPDPDHVDTVTSPTVPAPEPHPEPPPIADPPGEPVGLVDVFGPSSVPVRADGRPVLSWLSPAA